MINENQLSNILLIKNYRIKNYKNFFSSPLKKFLNNIYDKIEIPPESFIISLYYIYNFYNKNKSNIILVNNLFNNLNTYLLTVILISLKQIYDEPINTYYICDLMNINHINYIKTELIILDGLDWDTSYNNIKYDKFKKFLENYMDLDQHRDYIN